MSRARCLFWVQSLLGSGHLRRALLVAEALARHDFAVTLVNGGLPGPWRADPSVEIVQLPPLVADGLDFARLVEPDGTPATPALHAARRQRLLGLLEAQAPALLLTEMFPFGRRGFRGELLPWLAEARARRPAPLVACSVRDVLVSKADPARHAWMAETCLAHYDRVLVHGDERLLPFSATFPLADRLGERLVHTGFVLGPLAPLALTGAPPAVVVSAGGGAVGDRLLPTAVAARPLSGLAAEPWLVIGGQNLPATELAALARQAGPQLELVRYRPDLPALMAAATVSVSQAGYNTVVEGLAAGARMVLVPFAAGAEDEQEQRAQRLVALGLAERVAEAKVDGPSLAAAVDRIGARPRPDASAWSFDGAGRSARLITDWVQERFDER